MKKRKVAIWLPSIGACLLLIVVFVRIFSAEGESRETAAKGNGNQTTILLAGVDDAGFNTDMLMLCSLEQTSGKMKLAQIPRDTYYRTPRGEGKLNRIYRSNASKYGKKRAAECFCNEIERAFGLPLDGFIVFDIKTVGELVTLLGGVDVNVPHTFSYSDGKTGEVRTLTAGPRRLSSEEAMAFVRHRKSYAEGDLGRLDAQMRFLAGLCGALPRLNKFDQILAICQKILPNLLTNLTEKDIMEVMIAYFKNRSRFSVEIMRLPGEACYTDGVWYYVLNRPAVERMLTTELGSSTEFDAEGRFSDEKREAFRNIYTDTGVRYEVYTPEEMANKRVRRNGK